MEFTRPPSHAAVQKYCSRKCRWAKGKTLPSRRYERLSSKYGLSPNAARQLFDAANGECEICHEPLTLEKTPGMPIMCVDHNHVTGKIRGVLCNNCNTALGLMADSIARLQAAIHYLKDRHCDTKNNECYANA